ncbi:DUF2085 domain-containing protein [Methanobrevibacter sp. DSM 116169]|uniref:DUF2085 domain-containing protein n=1 Tax=Methanobrevibacter sp. DSM 116169 TaxID=3242727 RepID=UPI0038FCBE24
MDYMKLICHRMPERSFFIGKYQFPVCSRCTGFYIGVIAYLIYSNFNIINYSIGLFIFGLLLLLPAYVDGVSQYNGYRMSNNSLRLITGLLGGVGLGIIIKNITYFILGF